MSTIQPTIPVEVETRKNVFISQNRAGGRKTVIKSAPLRFYTLNFNTREFDEYIDYVTDWETNYPGIPISWTSPLIDASGYFYYDSEIKNTVTNPDVHTFNFTLRQETGLTPVDPETTLFPYKPNFVYDITDGMQVLINDSVGYARAASQTSDMLRQFQFTFKNRTLTETLAAENFWAFHYPKNIVTFEEETFDETISFWFDSNFKWTVNGENLIDYTFVLTEAVEPPTLPDPPSDPSSLSAAAISQSEIDLDWTDNSSDETGFAIERCTGAACTGFSQIATVGANVTTYNNTGLSADTLYRYRVRAFNAGGPSGYTNIAEATTDPFSYDPDSDGATLWLLGDDAAFTGHSDNTAESAWVNRATAVGGSWTQSTGANKPKYRTAVLNGLPVMEFDATDEMTGATQDAYANAAAYHFFFVIRPDSANCARIYGDGGSDLKLYSVSSVFKWYQYLGSSMSVELTWPTSYTIGNWYLIEVSLGSGLLSMRVGSASVINTSGVGNVGNLANTTGMDGQCAIAEILGWDVKLSSGLVTTYRSALQTKWGL